MTDQSADIAPKNAVSSSDAEPDENRVKINMRSLSGVDSSSCMASTGEVGCLATAAIYSKAFVEALAKRHADGVADLVRTRVRRKGKTATIAITADLPDEARLALLDLDVTADELRGKLVRWDSTTSTWRPR
jgi:hypothetical protein